MHLRFAFAFLAGVAAATSAAAQEPHTFLQQETWSAGGVSVDGVHFAFCTIDGAGHGNEDVWLEVWRPEGAAEMVTVRVGEAHAPTAATLDIDGTRYTLERQENGDFQTPAADSAAVVDAMERGHELTLQLEGGPAAGSFAYDLGEFTKARAAVAKSSGAS